MSFQRGLELYPQPAPSHLGLALAFRVTGSPASAEAAAARAEDALVTLARTRPVEAALVRAQLLTVRKDCNSAVVALEGLLRDGEPGFAAWTLPVEPFLRELHPSKGFTAILAQLAERAR